jgi:hypothetical protein
MILRIRVICRVAGCAAVLLVASLPAARAAGLSVLYDFPPSGNGDAAHGALPLAGLTPDPGGSGAFYGSTSRGGNYKANGYGGGVVYRLTPPAEAGAAWTQTVLHAFTGGQDGIFPGSGNVLVQGSEVFGTTAGQASFGDCSKGLSCDTVYQLTAPAKGQTAWTYQLLYRFTGGKDGEEPQGGLIADASGALYGTTAAGGNSGCTSSYTNQYGTAGCGTVFMLTPPAAPSTIWTKTVLHTFTGGSDGGIPIAGLLAAPGGSFALYGVASTGGSSSCSFGAYNCGVVFKLTPPKRGTTWKETVLYSFAGGSDGLAPLGVLSMHAGVLYGTAMSGGYGCNVYGCGTVFALTPPAAGQAAWTFGVLHAFTGGTDGGVPMAGVTVDTASSLYGTTFQYGSSNSNLDCGRFVGCGTIFKLAAPAAAGQKWAETVLHVFTGGKDGGQSSAGVTLSGSTLYGTAALGGSTQCPAVSDPTCGGVAFKIGK